MKGEEVMQPSLKKNYIYRVFYEILTLITPFITTPYVSRILGADGIGDYSFTNSIIAYFTLFGALGTSSYGAREIARFRNDKEKTSRLFWEIELLTVGTTGVCLLAWCGVVFFGGRFQLLYLALTPFLFATMFDITWYFTGLEMVRRIVVRNSLFRIFGIGILFLFVRKKEDLVVYTLINSGTALLGNLSLWLYLPKMLNKVNFRELRFGHHFHETMIYFIPTIATSIYTVLDKTLIGAITGNSYQNGYYEQATKVIKISKSFVFVAVNAIMTARMSFLFEEQKFDEIRRKIAKSLDFILLLGVGAVFGLLGISHRFVPVFFGEGYEPVENLIYLMSPLILIIGISNCLGSHYYTPSGKRKQSAKYIVAGAVINLVLNLCLIPLLGAQGAVIASIIAELAITFLYVRHCDGYLTAKKIFDRIWKRVIAGIVMTAAVWAVGRLNMNPIVVLMIQVISGVAVYGIVLKLLRDNMLDELIGMIAKKVQKLKGNKAHV